MRLYHRWHSAKKTILTSGTINVASFALSFPGSPVAVTYSCDSQSALTECSLYHARGHASLAAIYSYQYYCVSVNRSFSTACCLFTVPNPRTLTSAAYEHIYLASKCNQILLLWAIEQLPSVVHTLATFIPIFERSAVHNSLRVSE